MALAEARAAWQRTANRCLVQEDAKRAPKLVCSPSVTSSVKQTEKVPTTSADNGQDIPNTASDPFYQTPFYSTLSPNLKWWLQMQPNYGYQKVLMDEQFTSSGEGQNETCQDSLNLELKDVGCEFAKSADDIYFDSESSWIGGGKSSNNTPWWRTADTEELALLVAQRSVDILENCDLPRPQSTHVKKDNVRYFSRDEIYTSLLVRKAGNIEHHNHVCNHGSTQCNSTSCCKIRKSDEDQSRDSSTYEDDASRGQLLEALRHSQTRAREAEELMKRACDEKEHVVKIVLRQASQIFAYKQCLHLLQLENMYIQIRNSKTQSSSTVSPVMLPNWTTLGKRKIWRKCSNRKRGSRARAPCDVGKYAFVFALGLGLVGAGLLLGWSVGWMLPTW